MQQGPAYDSAILDERIRALRDEPIDWRHKGFPPSVAPVTPATVHERRWSLLAGDLPLPALVLRRSAVEHNLRLMAELCERSGALLAPHGKTTMAPELFKLQLDAGAWAMTVATIAQARVCRFFGVDRIILANELVEPVALRWVAAELASDPSFDFYCLVDSVEAVAAMSQSLAAAGAPRSVQVLLEVGFEGGRAGCRGIAAATEVAAAVRRAGQLELAGVEAYEGIIHTETLTSDLAAVDAFVRRLCTTVEELAGAELFDGRERILVSAGGSAFFDRVLAGLVGLREDCPAVDVVLRCGCYLTHDSGLYEVVSPLAGRSGGGERLQPAFEAWGVVLSRPEPERAIVGFGKRDVPFDIELPIPERVARGRELRDVRHAMELVDLNDHHAYARLSSGDELAVGDLLGCGICHPCLAFDRWQLIPVVDDDYTVVDALRTFF